jgi:hypothetical protein
MEKAPTMLAGIAVLVLAGGVAAPVASGRPARR